MEFVTEILSHPAATATLTVILVLGIAVVGYYIVRSMRPATRTDDTNVESLVENFAEMQREGDITDAELRRIESVVGQTQQSQTND